MNSMVLLFCLTMVPAADPSPKSKQPDPETKSKPNQEELKKTVAEVRIQLLLLNQAEAWNKGDLQGFMKGYLESDDLSFYSGNNKTKGWKATLERYQKKYQGEGKEMGKLKFDELSIELLGDDHALVRGRFHLELKKDTPTGIFTLILRKTPAGWRIIHDHTSS